MTAALELKNRLGDQHDVTVLSKARDFLFMPSLIWVPFGRRTYEDISFPLAPVFEKRGVAFKNVEATRIDLHDRVVEDSTGAKTPYDFLVIATGPKLDFDDVKGLGPNHHTQSIFSWKDAERAREAFERFVADPGPVVVGGVQGASCFGAAYEFLFNMAHELKKRGLQARAPLTYVTAEPFLAHFGMGGFGNGTKMTETFFKHLVAAVCRLAIFAFANDKRDDNPLLARCLNRPRQVPELVKARVRAHQPDALCCLVD